MKLGKKPVKHDKRTLQLGKYLRTNLLTPPTMSWWANHVSNWPMMLNDSIGDCTCAAAGHMIQEWTSNVGDLYVPSNQDVLKTYSAVSGYNPTTGANDNGAVELDVLNYWRSTGIGNHKILGYASIQPLNHDHIKDAVYLFGGCYIGLSLPISAQTGDIWTVPSTGPNGNGAPGSWGGHAVNIVGYDPNGLTCITWGAKKWMSWKFWDYYCEEAYAILSHDWINQKGLDPAGIDLNTLNSDLSILN